MYPLTFLSDSCLTNSHSFGAIIPMFLEKKMLSGKVEN
jgi:hypothetical protein